MKKFYFLLLFIFIAQLLVAQEDCSGISGNITPANATICEGSSVMLTVTGGSSYEWRLNDVVIDGETGSTITVTQAGTYSAIIKEGTCAVPASNTSTITVTPTPTGTISPANASFCEGGSVMLTATGGTSYTWFRDGVEINGETNSTLTVTAAGTYTTAIHDGDCSGTASNSSVVSVTPTPTGTISPASASICQGSSVVLTATGGTSYTWFRNGNEINGETNATLTVSQTGTYSVAIHQGDCSGPASNTSVVTRASTPTGSISPASASICPGSSVVLTATGGTSYTWFRNGNEINGVTDATLTVTQAGTYSVIIHQGNCSGQASNNSVVTLASTPTGSISPGSASICPGGSQLLTATGGTSYTWFLNGVEVAGVTDATLTATQAGIYTVTIHQGSCSGQASNSASVVLVPIPTGTISPASGSVCGGGSLTLTATGGSSYTWFRNGNEIAGETNATLNVTDPGTYFAIIRQATCSGPALNTAVITQASAPTGTISPATGSLCQGSSLMITATGGTSYTWYRNGNAIIGQTGATLYVTQPGTYTATIRQGDCSGPASNSSVISLASTPTGTISPATSSICEGGSVQLTATGGSSYTWFLNGAVIQGETGAILNATTSGTYTTTIQHGDCSGPSSNSAVVTITAAPTGTISPATAAICGGGSQVLTATGGTSYTWMRDGTAVDGETSATITVTQAGTYSVIINSGNCTAPASNTAIITSENEGGTRYDDVAARPNVPVQLSARDIGTTYEWLPTTDLSNPASRTPTVTTKTDHEYVVKITTANGCVVSDTVLVKVKSSIYVPTAFTPDGNGANDKLRPLGELGSIVYFKVFNRWGQLMFETKEIGSGWDGNYKGVKQPSDTYTWLISGIGSDGQPIKISGKTLLIR